MFESIVRRAGYGASALKLAATLLGLKPIKYFIDSTFRDKVTPAPGSVLYCDLFWGVEHSGIYVGDGEITNIVVEGVAESIVRRCKPKSFTSKSMLGRKIYVSCNQHGAVGHHAVAHEADKHLGERAFYGLIIKNCHQFSARSIKDAGLPDADTSLRDKTLPAIQPETWEPTLFALKETARKKLGATKWRLWDWENKGEEPPPEPDWQANERFFKNQPLTLRSIEQIRAELREVKAYKSEIADEKIPARIRQRVGSFLQTLEKISEKYEEAKDFLAAYQNARFSYADLKGICEDFAMLAKTLQDNKAIKNLTRKMGRNYISEEKNNRARIPEASRSEVHGTHRSNDVMRLLPSELLNLEDETLETLFYARLLEKNLLTYELQGITHIIGEQTETSKKRTGPVVACLDTSASMEGTPLLKAKALLLSIANILKKEGRSLHVLLFGASGQIKEYAMEDANDVPGLLRFLQQGFGGGTDFETPLRHALKIIAKQEGYEKADVLMISDGDCNLAPEFVQTVKIQKDVLDCSIYTVLCCGVRLKDAFSDETVVL